MASVIFAASKDSGPPRIQFICPDGPATCIKSNFQKWKQKNKNFFCFEGGKREDLGCQDEAVPGDLPITNPTAKVVFASSLSFGTLRNWIPTKRGKKAIIETLEKLILRGITSDGEGRNTFPRSRRSWFRRRRLGRGGEMIRRGSSARRMSWFLRSVRQGLSSWLKAKGKWKREGEVEEEEPKQSRETESWGARLNRGTAAIFISPAGRNLAGIERRPLFLRDRGARNLG